MHFLNSLQTCLLEKVPSITWCELHIIYFWSNLLKVSLNSVDSAAAQQHATLHIFFRIQDESSRHKKRTECFALYENTEIIRPPTWHKTLCVSSSKIQRWINKITYTFTKIIHYSSTKHTAFYISFFFFKNPIYDEIK